MERTERAVLRVHLSRVNTQISFSLTTVMVEGVSLNNPAAAACDVKILDYEGTTRWGKLSGHHLSCSVQYFNTFGTSVKRIIKQQGHVWTSRHFIPFFLSGEMEKYAWKTSGWRPALPNYSLERIIHHKPKSVYFTFCSFHLHMSQQ